MSTGLANRLRDVHALPEMALKDERARPRPNDRTLAQIREKRLAVRDRLAIIEPSPASVVSR